jgi:4-carboxymuconolactone decarboxylase
LDAVSNVTLRVHFSAHCSDGLASDFAGMPMTIAVANVALRAGRRSNEANFRRDGFQPSAANAGEFAYPGDWAKAAARAAPNPVVASANILGRGTAMARIAILDRGDMNAEQAHVYDAAKQSSGIVGGPYYAYIRLPKLFAACQNLRAALSSGPLSAREQQIVNLVVARHWNARYPWFAQVRRSLAVGIEQAAIDAINEHGTPHLADARERTCLAVARELLAGKGLSDKTYAAAENAMGPESLVALVASIGSFSMTCMTTNTFGIEPPAENPTPLAT